MPINTTFHLRKEIKMDMNKFFVGLASVLMTATAMADGLTVEPGKWEMTTTMKMNMMPEAKVNTSTECIKDSVLDPKEFDMDKDNPCIISDMSIKGNSANWKVSCPFEGGMSMDGQWNITSNGDSITGGGNMAAEVSGMKMDMKMSWEGHRVGACD